MKTNLLNTTFLNFKGKTMQFLAFGLLILTLISCNKKAEETPATEAKPSETTETAQVAPANPPENFKHATAVVNGIKIHYVIGGKGDPLVLVHGFGQNWYMWNRLIPELSKHFTVIAPDLRGVGESDKPESVMIKKQWRPTFMNWLKNWVTLTSILPDMTSDLW